jgi:IS4 transposase
MGSFDRIISVQDTTVICYSSLQATEGLGSIGLGAFGNKGKGILLHTTMAFTTSGMPLGILHQDMWSRGILKEDDVLFESERLRWLTGIKKSSKKAGVEIIHIADREADGSDFFATAIREGEQFVIRAKERLRKSGAHDGKFIVDILNEQPSVGIYSINVRAQKIGVGNRDKYRAREERVANLNVRYGEVILKPQQSSLIRPLSTEVERTIKAVLVEEINPPKGYEPVCWLLFTNLPIDSLEQAKEVIDLYKIRWQIEIFHKVLKSACGIEKAQLGHADKLKRLITMLSIVAWRLHLLSKLSRDYPERPCTEILTKAEWQTLFIMIHKSKQQLPEEPPTLKEAVIWIAKLGGFIGRKCDGEPGPLSLWRGWQRLVSGTEVYKLMSQGKHV